MDNAQKRRRKGHFHAFYNLKYHLVLVTKYRRKCFTDDILHRLESMCRDLSEHWSVEVLEFNGEEDHIHMLIDAHPAMDLSKYINNLKTVTSRLLRKEYGDHIKKYLWNESLWSRAYCLLSVGGAPIEVIRQYIENQDRPK